jgi:DNA-binding phage protein
MSPTPIEESNSELTALGKRIREHDAETAAIDRDLSTAIERARTARLSMEEIARQTGLSRPTLYSTLRRAKEQATKSRPGKLHRTQH